MSLLRSATASAVVLIILCAVRGTAAESREPIGPDRALVVDEEVWPYFNWASFDQDKVVSFGDYQYCLYWDADMTLVVVRRDLRTDEIQTLRLPEFTLTINPRDGHRNTVVGISPSDGRLHLSWDHHNNDLRYTRSRAGFLTKPPERITGDDFEPAQPLTADAPQSVTYPRFFNNAQDDLFFFYRSGGSGSGDSVLFRYDASAGHWQMISNRLLGRQGVYPPWNNSSSRNAYLHDLLFDLRGRLHLTWVYREEGATWASNHDLHYAYSDDEGITWKNNAGDQVADTRLDQQIVIGSPGIVVRKIPVFSWLMNQCAMTLDSKNQPHVATYHMPQTFRPEELRHDPPQSARHRLRYYHYWRDSHNDWHRSDPLELPLPPRRPQIISTPDDTILLYFATEQGFQCHFARSSDGWREWKTCRLTGPEYTACDATKHDRRLLRERGILSFTADPKGLESGSGFAILDFQMARVMQALQE